ncbi:MAG: helix-turn-helix transcriptional regulator [Sarcina sp.]|nr:helix-turn-helix transcriptional regulator [Sarcina sp.]
MDQETRERIRINNEKGIIRESGGGFHSPLESAVRHMFYTAWSGRYECNRIYSVRREHLDFYSVIYVLEGQLEVEYEGKTLQVRQNEAVLLDFHKPHAYRAVSDRVDKWEMLFKGNESAAWYEMVTGDGDYLFKAAGRLQRTLTGLMEELNAPYPQDHTISLLIHTMFCNMIDQKALTLSPPVEEAILYMNSHYGDNIQIGEIADHVSLSRFYFSRLFRKETGRSPNEYLADIRINAAKEMLTERIYSITEISELCGFTNTSHFTRFFREKTGQTPAAFRSSFNLKGI